MKHLCFLKKNTIQMKLMTTTMATVALTVLICFLSISIYLEPYLHSIFIRDTFNAVQSSSRQLSYYLDERSEEHTSELQSQR